MPPLFSRTEIETGNHYFAPKGLELSLPWRAHGVETLAQFDLALVGGVAHIAEEILAPGTDFGA